MVSNSYSEIVVKGLVDAFEAAKEKVQHGEDSKRTLVRFSFNLMQNFLEGIGETSASDNESDGEVVHKELPNESACEKISESNASIPTPVDCTVFTAPAVEIRRRLKRKVSHRHIRRT